MPMLDDGILFGGGSGGMGGLGMIVAGGGLAAAGVTC